ncbi:MAG: hypothetical protein ACR2KV_06270 [Solirubrobacteraceae bacterium]
MPRRFPIVQWPNRSLFVAFAAGLAARAAAGPTRRAAGLVSRLATLFWAAQEVLRGANWLRRLLGLVVGARTGRALARRADVEGGPA